MVATLVATFDAAGVVTFLLTVTAGLTVGLVATLATGFATTLVAGFATTLVAGFATTLVAGFAAALVATFVAAFAFVTGFILSFGDCAADFGGAFLALTTLIGVLVGTAFLAADEVGALATFLLTGKVLDTVLLLLLLTLLALLTATDVITTAVLAVALTAVFAIGLALVAFLAVVCLVALLLVLVSRRVVVIIALCLSHLIRIYRHQTAGGAEPRGNCKQVRLVIIRQNVIHPLTNQQGASCIARFLQMPTRF